MIKEIIKWVYAITYVGSFISLNVIAIKNLMSGNLFQYGTSIKVLSIIVVVCFIIHVINATYRELS